MGASRSPSTRQDVWAVVGRQHGVVTRAQLIECGFSPKAITHRIDSGRLHRLHRGVYAVGRPELTRLGRWMGAVLSCGRGAVLSHDSAAALWDIADRERLVIISIPRPRQLRRDDLEIHRVPFRAGDLDNHQGIPVTSPVRTLIDLAPRLSPPALEAAVNAADRLGLVDPETLRNQVAGRSHVPGLPALRRLLDRDTFRLTDSELERRFLRLVASAGLPIPQTGIRLNGFKVDFYWPDLGLVVETDGLRYHRTASQQARDRRRDHAHLAAGLTTVRFTHAQIAHEPASVIATLRALAGRLSADEPLGITVGVRVRTLPAPRPDQPHGPPEAVGQQHGRQHQTRDAVDQQRHGDHRRTAGDEHHQQAEGVGLAAEGVAWGPGRRS